MDKKNVLIITLVIIALLVFGASIFESKNDNQDASFRCNGPTRYILETGEFRVSQDLRIVGLKSAYFTLEGYYQGPDGQHKRLHRVIYMNNGGKTYRNTYLFHIDSIHSSVNDTLTDEEFYKLLMEFTPDKTMMSLDINHVSEKLYLIGTAQSYMFTCNSY